MERVNPDCKHFESYSCIEGPGSYHINRCLIGKMDGFDCSTCDIYIQKSIKDGKSTTIDQMRDYFARIDRY